MSLDPETMTESRSIGKTAGEIRREISSLQQRIGVLEKELLTAPVILSEAISGDILGDRSIVIEANPDSMLVVAPDCVSQLVHWDMQNEAFNALERSGFIRGQWFIPTEEQLRVAYLSNARRHFSKAVHWASGQKSYGCVPHFDFEIGRIHEVGLSGDRFGLVRPFRLIHF